MKAWRESFERLADRAGDGWPVGTKLSTPEVDNMESAAESATVLYILDGNAQARELARESLVAWEDAMSKAIDAALLKRGCGQCGVEKVVEVVDQDGARSCGRCRAGIH
jgi:hypothetical protein